MLITGKSKRRAVGISFSNPVCAVFVDSVVLDRAVLHQWGSIDVMAEKEDCMGGSCARVSFDSSFTVTRCRLDDL